MAHTTQLTRTAPRQAPPARAPGLRGKRSAFSYPRRSVGAARSLVGLVVLVVEDHDDSRDVMRQFLEAKGARVLQAAEGAEALRILARETPDVVLCDPRMPGMGGSELIRRLRAHPTHARLRVLALTALDSDRHYMETLVAGFDGHLAKPVDWKRLLRILDGERRRPHGKPRARSRRPEGRVRTETER